MKSQPSMVRALCRCDCGLMAQWAEQPRAWAAVALVVVLGAGAYGATMGLWRAPLQAVYTAIKFPALMLLTTAGNALLNGMLAPLLGLRVGFRQSTFAVLLSFAVAAVILASFAPITLFILWNTPPLKSVTSSSVLAHNFTLLTHIFFIALAGVTGNVHLFRFLKYLSPGQPRVAGKVLAAWLAGNLFLGCQLSWVMRPFIGAPHLPVAFFRPDAMAGNFYEAAWRAWVNLWTL